MTPQSAAELDQALVAIDGAGLVTMDVIHHEGRPWLVPSWLENQVEGWQTPERLILLATIPHQVEPVGTGRRYVVNIELPRSLLDPLTPWTGGMPFVVVDRPAGIRILIVRH